VSSKKGLSATPAAAANQPLRGFSDKIGAVFNQIAIDTKHRRNRRFDLRVVVMFAAQPSRRRSNQCADRFPVVHLCETYDHGSILSADYAAYTEEKGSHEKP